MTETRIAVDCENYLGEGPIWSARDGALWWINCEQPPELHRWRPQTGERESWPMPSRIGGFVFKATGGLLVALADGVHDFDPGSGALDLRAASPFPAHVRLHECHCDRQGRFWVGGFDHRFPGDRQARGAAFCRLDRDGQGWRLVPVIPDISVANGLAFSPDGHTMYAADAPSRTVMAFDIDPATGDLSNRRTFLALGEGEGFVDGATVDAEGGYWLANVAAGRLRRHLPDGTLDRIVDLPFSNPTKPAFGGPDLGTLFVTSTRLAMPEFCAPSVANGPVFALEPGFRGVPEAEFAPD